MYFSWASQNTHANTLNVPRLPCSSQAFFCKTFEIEINRHQRFFTLLNQINNFAPHFQSLLSFIAFALANSFKTSSFTWWFLDSWFSDVWVCHVFLLSAKYHEFIIWTKRQSIYFLPNISRAPRHPPYC